MGINDNSVQATRWKSSISFNVACIQTQITSKTLSRNRSTLVACRWTTNIIAHEIISNHIFHLCVLLYSIMRIDREEIHANDKVTET